MVPPKITLGSRLMELRLEAKLSQRDLADAGVASLTRSLAVEWSKKGVTLNAIAPGVVRTTLNADLLDGTPQGHELLMRTPMGRFGETGELVGAAVYLCSDAAW